MRQSHEPANRTPSLSGSSDRVRQRKLVPSAAEESGTPAENGVRGKDSTSYPRLSTHRHGARTALLITLQLSPIDQPFAVSRGLPLRICSWVRRAARLLPRYQ